MVMSVSSELIRSCFKIQLLYGGVLLHRHNLDPENQQTDNELWRSLEISQLKETVNLMPGGLGKMSGCFQASKFKITEWYCERGEQFPFL